MALQRKVQILYSQIKEGIAGIEHDGEEDNMVILDPSEEDDRNIFDIFALILVCIVCIVLKFVLTRISASATFCVSGISAWPCFLNVSYLLANFQPRVSYRRVSYKKNV